MTKPHDAHDPQTSLDVLRDDNALLLDLFEKIERNRGDGVEARYEYGSAAKQIIHHAAIRRAAVTDVASGAEVIPELRDIAARLKGQALSHLGLLDELDDRSRSIQGMYLNEGQDFDEPLRRFIGLVRGDIEWERSEALPAIGRALAAGASIELKSAGYIRHHAPTTLRASGPGWFERLPVVSRIMATLSFLRDHPRAPRDERVRS